MIKIVHGEKMYTGNDIVSAEAFKELSPIGASLGYGTFNIDLRADSEILNYSKNSPIKYYDDDTLKATYYTKNISRSGATKYSIEAVDSIGLLAARQHMGGIYSGTEAESIIDDICGEIPHSVDARFTGIKLYGWLPMATGRDNLKQVIFALGAVIVVSADGKINVKALSRDIKAEIAKVGQNADVEYPAPVSGIKLTEHQFIKSATAEIVTLYEGTATAETPITFDEPVYDLTATGFEIISSGANFAYVSAGTGTVSGKKYIHAQRVISRQITADADENEYEYEDATLVSVVNSAAVLSRLVNYHRQGNILTADTRLEGQGIGDMIKVLHPHDREMVAAFIYDMQLTCSRKTIASQHMLLGFIPPDPNAGIYNTVEILTGSGAWTPPDGVESVRVILIGGGTGGWSGLPGAAAAEGSQPSETSFGTTYYRVWPGRGGAGGKAGAAGAGGKIYQELIELPSGADIAYSCGPGGAGGIFSIEESIQGAAGGNTIFGNLSSANGAISETGFLEEINGQIYAASGKAGIAGGSGTGINNEGTDIEQGENVEYTGTTYTPGTTDESTINITYPSGTQHVRAVAGNGYGGGAAAGANGNAGKTNKRASINSAQALIGTGDGGDGADAVAPAAPALYGTGGSGGNGGGGGGGCGAGVISRDDNVSSVAGISIVRYPGTPGAGGDGSNGGAGAPGCIILYYYLASADT